MPSKTHRRVTDILKQEWAQADSPEKRARVREMAARADRDPEYFRRLASDPTFGSIGLGPGLALGAASFIPVIGPAIGAGLGAYGVGQLAEGTSRYLDDIPGAGGQILEGALEAGLPIGSSIWRALRKVPGLETGLVKTRTVTDTTGPRRIVRETVKGAGPTPKPGVVEGEVAGVRQQSPVGTRPELTSAPGDAQTWYGTPGGVLHRSDALGTDMDLWNRIRGEGGSRLDPSRTLPPGPAPSPRPRFAPTEDQIRGAATPAAREVLGRLFDEAADEGSARISTIYGSPGGDLSRALPGRSATTVPQGRPPGHVQALLDQLSGDPRPPLLARMERDEILEGLGGGGASGPQQFIRGGRAEGGILGTPVKSAVSAPQEEQLALAIARQDTAEITKAIDAEAPQGVAKRVAKRVPDEEVIRAGDTAAQVPPGTEVPPGTPAPQLMTQPGTSPTASTTDPVATTSLMKEATTVSPEALATIIARLDPDVMAKWTAQGQANVAEVTGMMRKLGQDDLDTLREWVLKTSTADQLDVLRTGALKPYGGIRESQRSLLRAFTKNFVDKNGDVTAASMRRYLVEEGLVSKATVKDLSDDEVAETAVVALSETVGPWVRALQDAIGAVDKEMGWRHPPGKDIRKWQGPGGQFARSPLMDPVLSSRKPREGVRTMGRQFRGEDYPPEAEIEKILKKKKNKGLSPGDVTRTYLRGHILRPGGGVDPERLKNLAINIEEAKMAILLALLSLETGRRVQALGPGAEYASVG